MNRENKRKNLKQVITKITRVKRYLSVKFVADWLYQNSLEQNIAIIVQIVYRVYMWIMNQGIAKVIAGVIWTLSLFGFVKMVNGQFCIVVDVAGK